MAPLVLVGWVLLVVPVAFTIPEHQVGEEVGGLGLHAGDDVGGGVQREGHRAVAQPLGDDLRVHPGPISNVVFGLSGLVILIAISFEVARERGENGRFPTLWILFVVLATPIGLSAWYFVSGRASQNHLKDVENRIILGLAILAALGVLYISTRV